MKNVATAFFAGFFAVIAIALLFVNSDQTATIIAALGKSLSDVGGTLATGGNGSKYTQKTS